MPTATYVLTIAGVDQTTRVRAFTLNISRAIGQPHSLSCQIMSEEGTYRPALNAEVIVTEDGSRVFAGYIVTARELGLKGYGSAEITTEIVAHDYTQLLRRIYTTTAFPSQTLKQRLTAVVAELSSYSVTLHGSQVDGPTLEARDYSTTESTLENVVLDAQQETASSAQYFIRIDYDKKLHGVAVGAQACPYNVIDNGVDGTGLNHFGDLTVEQSRSDRYANRIIVKAGTGTQIHTAAFTADGVDTSWQTDLPSVSVGDYWPGVILLDAVSVPIGPYENPTLGAASFYQLQWDPATHTIYQRTGDAPLANGTTLSMLYMAQYPFTHIVEDAGEIAANGLTEYILPAPGAMTLAAAEAAGQAELAARLAGFKQVSYSSHELGALPGQTQTITFPNRALSGSFLLNEVTTRDDNGVLLVTTIKAVQGTKPQATFHKTYEYWGIAGSGAALPPTAAASTGTPFLPAGPNKAIQSNKNGSLYGDDTLLHDDDGSGEDYGVEGLPAELAVVLQNDNKLAQAWWNRNASADPDDALTLWIDDSNTAFLEFEGEIAIFTYGGEIQLSSAARLLLSANTSVPPSSHGNVAIRGITTVEGATVYVSRETSTFTIDSGGNLAYTMYHVDTSGGAVTANLPDTAGTNITPSLSTGRLIGLKNIGSNDLVLDPHSTQVIYDGTSSAATLTIPPGASALIQARNGGTNPGWYVMASHGFGGGDVVGPASSVDKEIALFDGTTGKLLERATGSGIVRVASGVYGTPGNVVETEITLADNTTNNVSTSAHGFTPKLPNDDTKYLDGTGNWSEPAGGSAVSYVPLAEGTEPLAFISDGFGQPILIPFEP